MVLLAVAGGLRGAAAAASGAGSKALAKCPGMQKQAHEQHKPVPQRAAQHSAQHGHKHGTAPAHPGRHVAASSAAAAAAAAAPSDDTRRITLLHGQPSPTQDVRQADDELPQELYNLLDAAAHVRLPAASAPGLRLNNWKLDKLVSQLGKNKATWRRAIVLYEWLKDCGHQLDDRLCTTLIRLCADHRDAMSALGVYEWMRAPTSAGGGALRPSVFTYTAVMRAALNSGLLERALQVWDDCAATGTRPDSRLCVIFMEACARLGHTDRALGMYAMMRAGPPRAPCAPTVHAYTAAMRAASEGGRWQAAMDIWDDLCTSGCAPTAHAYAAAISACASGRAWQRAVSLFEEMTAGGITPDVVSCTALVSALAAGGETDKAEAVVQWMLRTGLTPNVRTYTALMAAVAAAGQCRRAVQLLYKMQLPEWGGVTPNAYSYSVLIKAMGDAGYWQLAEAVFGDAEQAAMSARAGRVDAEAAATAEQRLLADAAPRPPVWSSASQLNGITLDFPVARGVGAGGRGAVTGVAREQLDAQPQQQHGFSLFSGGGAAPHAGAAPMGLRPKAATPPNAPRAPAPGEGRPAEVRGSEPARSLSPSPRSSAAREPSEAVVNEVVCGSMMLAYERAGMWAEAVGVLGRASAMGVQPNTVMYNTALAAVGKAGQLELAESLFAQVPAPDAVTHESLIAAYGLCGQPAKAETLLKRMVRRGFRPRDYAWCGLVAAYSLAGDTDGALAVLRRVRQDGGTPSIHVYNALLAACERGSRTDAALKLLARLKKDGLEPNGVTNTLMSVVGRQGVQSVEGQQAALAAISAAVAAAGGILMSRGVF